MIENNRWRPWLLFVEWLDKDSLRRRPLGLNMKVEKEAKGSGKDNLFQKERR